MVTLMIALLACGGGKDSEGGGDSSGTGGTGGTTGDPTAGADVYASYCTSCHGEDGALGVEIGGEPSADLSAEVPEKSDEELTDIIQNGYGTMPAQAVTDAELPDLIAYLRATFP